MDTITITTPEKSRTVVIRSYRPVKLRQATQSLLLRGREFAASEGADGLNKQLQSGEIKIKGEMLEELTNLTMEYMVVSVDGKTENVLYQLLEMTEADFDFVAAEVEKVAGPLANKK